MRPTIRAGPISRHRSRPQVLCPERAEKIIATNEEDIPERVAQIICDLYRCSQNHSWATWATADFSCLISACVSKSSAITDYLVNIMAMRPTS
ncbi:hypothetical protein WJX74_002544 [Apatococcus lobatus]